MTAYSKRPEAPDNRSRVFRGGTWLDTSAAWVRAACRFGITPLVRCYDIGFRTTQSGCRQFLVNP